MERPKEMFALLPDIFLVLILFIYTEEPCDDKATDVSSDHVLGNNACVPGTIINAPNNPENP